MIPSVGRLVHYKLSQSDVSQYGYLAKQRGTANVSGNSHSEGDEVPFLICRVWAGPDGATETTPVNGQAFLDGDATLWLTSRAQGGEVGQWHEPERVGVPVSAEPSATTEAVPAAPEPEPEPLADPTPSDTSSSTEPTADTSSESSTTAGVDPSSSELDTGWQPLPVSEQVTAEPPAAEPEPQPVDEQGQPVPTPEPPPAA